MVTPRLVGSIQDLAPLIDQLSTAGRMAVDTEFHPERRSTPELYVVSIAVPGGPAHVIDGLKPDLLARLRPHTAGKEWVLHSARQDLMLLAPTLGSPASVFDTQVAAGLCTTVYPAPFSWLLPEILGVEPAPEATMSDWSHRPLSTRQLRYAAGDVAHLCELADRLSKTLDALGRRDMAAQATQEILATDQNKTWRDIRGADSLDPRGGAILEELVVLRDRLAHAAQTSATAVIGDGHLLDLAKRQPLTPERVGANRRFPRRFASQHGPTIAEIVQRVLRRPPHLLPVRYARGSTEEAHRARIWADVLQQALHASWAAPLVVPPVVLDALAAGRVPSDWRGPLLNGGKFTRTAE